MRISIYLLCLTLCVSCLALGPLPEGGERAAAEKFAEKIFEFYDQRKYKEIYEYFNADMRRELTLQQFENAARQLATMGGEKKSRVLADYKTSWSWHQFYYDAQYARGKAREELFVIKDNDRWSIGRFLVQPKQ